MFILLFSFFIGEIKISNSEQLNNSAQPWEQQMLYAHAWKRKIYGIRVAHIME